MTFEILLFFAILIIFNYLHYTQLLYTLLMQFYTLRTNEPKIPMKQRKESDTNLWRPTVLIHISKQFTSTFIIYKSNL